MGGGTRNIPLWRTPVRKWVTVARTVYYEIKKDHLSIVASGVAFFGLVAIFPVLSALISVYGALTGHQSLDQHAAAIGTVVSPDLTGLLRRSLHSVAGASGFALGVGIAFSLITALWAATRSMLGLMTALNIVYNEEERRSPTARVLTAMILAVMALVFWVFAVLVIADVPSLIDHVYRQHDSSSILVGAARWLFLIFTALISMAALYRFGPCRPQPKWQWLSLGAVVATLLWLTGSVCFSFYLRHFGSLNRVYGSLGVILILQAWFFLTAFVFLLGAELNVAVRRHLAED